MLKMLAIFLLGGLLVSYGSTAIPNGATAVTSANFGASRQIILLHYLVVTWNSAGGTGCMRTVAGGFLACSQTANSYLHDHPYTGTPYFRDIHCIVNNATGASDSGDQFSVSLAYHEPDTGQTLSDNSFTIDLTTAPGYYTGQIREFAKTADAGVAIRLVNTDSGTAVSDVDIVCSLEMIVE